MSRISRQGLVRKTELSDTAHNPTRVVSLTKEGHKLLFCGRSLPPIRPSHLVLLAGSYQLPNPWRSFKTDMSILTIPLLRADC